MISSKIWVAVKWLKFNSQALTSHFESFWSIVGRVCLELGHCMTSKFSSSLASIIYFAGIEMLGCVTDTWTWFFFICESQTFSANDNSYTLGLFTIKWKFMLQFFREMQIEKKSSIQHNFNWNEKNSVSAKRTTFSRDFTSL